MAGVSDAALKEMTQEERVTALGMRTDQLTGRAMAISFDPDEKERFDAFGPIRSPIPNTLYSISQKNCAMQD